MKPAPKERAHLQGRLLAARERAALTNAQIAATTKVDASQVSRILSGEFRTISGSVVRICKALGVDPSPAGRGAGRRAAAAAKRTREEAAWSRLESSMRHVWDHTPEGADRLARILDTIAEVREASS
jgi:transcriptional regulator with XRE-family HTH domain